MATVEFTPNLQRILDCPTGDHPGDTVRAVLEAAFASHPRVRSYVLDDQGSVRKHVVVFLNGAQVTDRRTLSDAVGPDDQLLVMQALSGG
ncbi:MAG: MoaD/ThiS family protein [Myxococcota bacterium]